MDVRVLHPLRLPAGPTGDSPIRGLHVGVAVDVETTSLDFNEVKIVQIALRCFVYNVDRVITDVHEPFDAKDRLKARGYRWDPAEGRRVWWREVNDDDLSLERLWLAVNVYADERAQHICPELETINPRTRFI